MQIINPYQQYMYSYPHKTAYGPLFGVHLKDYAHRLSGRENSLYFHIPFCQSKCGYCNLFSIAKQMPQQMEQYVDAMERQAAQLAEILPSDAGFQSLTLGGGTPLLLPVYLLERIFETAKRYFGCKPGSCAVAAETSPNQTTEEKLAFLKKAGTCRISIGIQSFQETELKTLVRFHTAEAARKALRLIKQMKFDCVNIDLIYGIAGQTVESLTDSLEQAVMYEPDEIFAYPLYIQPGTYLYEKGVHRSRETWQMYWHVRGFLLQAGYRPYSMRRFVRKHADTDDRLQDASCGFSNTLAVGCGGRSYIGNLHFCTPYAVRQEQCRLLLAEYMKTDDYLLVTHGYLLPPEEEKRRYAVRHILFGNGLNRVEYKKHFETDALDDFEQFLEWEKEGCAVITDECVTLTEEGFALSDYLGPQLISEEVRNCQQLI